MLKKLTEFFATESHIILWIWKSLIHVLLGGGALSKTRNRRCQASQARYNIILVGVGRIEGCRWHIFQDSVHVVIHSVIPRTILIVRVGRVLECPRVVRPCPRPETC